jgi:hypothetical protein
MLPRSNIATYDNMSMRAVVKDMKIQRTSRVEVPDLVRTNSVKSGEISCAQQIVDTCAVAPVAAESLRKSGLSDTLRGTIHLLIKSPFWMGRKLK